MRVLIFSVLLALLALVSAKDYLYAVGTKTPSTATDAVDFVSQIVVDGSKFTSTTEFVAFAKAASATVTKETILNIASFKNGAVVLTQSVDSTGGSLVANNFQLHYINEAGDVITSDVTDLKASVRIASPSTLLHVYNDKIYVGFVTCSTDAAGACTGTKTVVSVAEAAVDGDKLSFSSLKDKLTYEYSFAAGNDAVYRLVGPGELIYEEFHTTTVPSPSEHLSGNVALTTAGNAVFPKSVLTGAVSGDRIYYGGSRNTLFSVKYDLTGARQEPSGGAAYNFGASASSYALARTVIPTSATASKSVYDLVKSSNDYLVGNPIHEVIEGTLEVTTDSGATQYTQLSNLVSFSYSTAVASVLAVVLSVVSVFLMA